MEADHTSKKKFRIKKEGGGKKKKPPRKQKEEHKTRMHAPWTTKSKNRSRWDENETRM
jgi:hypothetical protein